MPKNIQGLTGEIVTYMMRGRRTPSDLRTHFRLSVKTAQHVYDLEPDAFGPSGRGRQWYHTQVGALLKAPDAFEAEIPATPHRSSLNEVAAGALRASVSPLAEHELSEGIADTHQVKIATRTLQLSAMGAKIMGGMDHAGAVKVLRANGWPDTKIKAALKKHGHADPDVKKWLGESSDTLSLDEARPEPIKVPETVYKEKLAKLSSKDKEALRNVTMASRGDHRLFKPLDADGAALIKRLFGEVTETHVGRGPQKRESAAEGAGVGSPSRTGSHAIVEGVLRVNDRIRERELLGEAGGAGQEAPKDPKWGTPYGLPMLHPSGTAIRMRRKGQRVRFFDLNGKQVGPEHANVAPAVAWAMSKGFVTESVDEAGKPLKVKCGQCGNVFATNKDYPKCPKCGSKDVDLPESVDEAASKTVLGKYKQKTVTLRDYGDGDVDILVGSLAVPLDTAKKKGIAPPKNPRDLAQVSAFLDKALPILFPAKAGFSIESVDEASGTTVRAAVRLDWLKGATAGVTPDEKVVVFRSSDYDNKGTVSGSYAVLGRSSQRDLFSSLHLEWNSGFTLDRGQHAQNRKRAEQAFKKLPTSEANDDKTDDLPAKAEADLKAKAKEMGAIKVSGKGPSVNATFDDKKKAQAFLAHAEKVGKAAMRRSGDEEYTVHIDESVERYAGAKMVGGSGAVPFSALKVGAQFRFPKSDEINTKTSEAGSYKTANGRKFKTGKHAAVIPAKSDESLDEAAGTIVRTFSSGYVALRLPSGITVLARDTGDGEPIAHANVAQAKKGLARFLSANPSVNARVRDAKRPFYILVEDVSESLDEAAPKKSKGHIAFLGDFEYLIVGTDLARAPISNVMDVRTGNRLARFEATKAAADTAMKIAFQAFGKPVDPKAMQRMRKLLGESLEEDIDEDVRPGQMFVVVDVSVRGGKMIGEIYTGAARADAAASKLKARGQNVQVIDALWYEPARQKLIKSGLVGEDAEPRVLALGDGRYAVDLGEGEALVKIVDTLEEAIDEAGRLAVKCMECGKKFKTASMLPDCPKCGGSDIEPDYDAPSAKKSYAAGRTRKRSVGHESIIEGAVPKVGDRVALSRDHLRGTGNQTGTLPQLRGTVTAVSGAGIATVDWGRGVKSPRVNVKNLVVLGKGDSLPVESADEGLAPLEVTVTDVFDNGAWCHPRYTVNVRTNNNEDYTFGMFEPGTEPAALQTVEDFPNFTNFIKGAARPGEYMERVEVAALPDVLRTQLQTLLARADTYDRTMEFDEAADESAIRSFDVMAQMRWEETLKPGAKVMVYWTAGSFGHYQGKATVKSLNKSSVTVTLDHDVPDRSRLGGAGYAKGKKINVPRVMANYGRNTWSMGFNAVHPLGGPQAFMEGAVDEFTSAAVPSVGNLHPWAHPYGSEVELMDEPDELDDEQLDARGNIEPIDEAIQPTVAGFRMFVVGALTQWDKQQEVRASKKPGGSHSPYALSLYLEALHRGEKSSTMRGVKPDSMDPEDLRKFAKMLGEQFFSDMPPIRKTLKAIDAYLASGKAPKYPGSSSRSLRSESRDETARLAKGLVYTAVAAAEDGRLTEAVAKLRAAGETLDEDALEGLLPEDVVEALNEWADENDVDDAIVEGYAVALRLGLDDHVYGLDEATSAAKLLDTADSKLISELRKGLVKVGAAAKEAKRGQAEMEKRLGVGKSTAKDQLKIVVKELEAYRTLLDQIIKQAQVAESVDEDLAEAGSLHDALLNHFVRNRGRSYTASEIARLFSASTAESMKTLSSLVNEGTLMFRRGEGYSLRGNSSALRIPASLHGSRVGNFVNQRTEEAELDEVRNSGRPTNWRGSGEAGRDALQARGSAKTKARFQVTQLVAKSGTTPAVLADVSKLSTSMPALKYRGKPGESYDIVYKGRVIGTLRSSGSGSLPWTVKRKDGTKLSDVGFGSVHHAVTRALADALGDAWGNAEESADGLGEGLGRKVFYTRDGVGSSKYTVNYHDGKTTHSDGSPFYGIFVFPNKAKRDQKIRELLKQGYEEVSSAVHETTTSGTVGGYRRGKLEQPENKGRTGGIRDDGPGKKGPRSVWSPDAIAKVLEQMREALPGHSDEELLELLDEAPEEGARKDVTVFGDGKGKWFVADPFGKQERYATKTEAVQAGRDLAQHENWGFVVSDPDVTLASESIDEAPEDLREIDPVDTIQRGDKVTILIPAGLGRQGQEWKPKAGKAVMRGPHGWVLNMGGAHGTPGVASSRNIVKVQRGGKTLYHNPRPDVLGESVDEAGADNRRPVKLGPIEKELLMQLREERGKHGIEELIAASPMLKKLPYQDVLVAAQNLATLGLIGGNGRGIVLPFGESEDAGLDEASVPVKGHDTVTEVGFARGTYYYVSKSGLKNSVAVKRKDRASARERFRQMLRNEANVKDADALIKQIDAKLGESRQWARYEVQLDEEFFDRYDALGIERPDPKTMCHGQCEGTGWVPIGPPEGRVPEGRLFCPADNEEPWRTLWLEAEEKDPTDDGYHIVKCPDCEGTGKDQGDASHGERRRAQKTERTTIEFPESALETYVLAAQAAGLAEDDPCFVFEDGRFTAELPADVAPRIMELVAQ
jgi:Zn finger protein HypA/HybF involved in hydrogenase expression